MVFQSAMNSLNPVLTHRGPVLRRAARPIPGMYRARRPASAPRSCSRSSISRPIGLRAYPHQLSGGMRQRIVIAICLALNPKLLIMDEPTTALDVVVQREILQRIDEAAQELGFSVLFITHDLGLMVQVSDRIGIMLEGETGRGQNSAGNIYRRPQHEYTRKLWASFPRCTAHRSMEVAAS